jgi:hypothetical protein
MPTPRPLPNTPHNLPERIAALRAEIDSLIDQMAAEAAVSGVPIQVTRNLITRNSQCQCRSYLIHMGELK